MKSNFEFLNRYWPALAQIGAAAESYVYSDANACLYKCNRQISRRMDTHGIIVVERFATFHYY